MSQRPLTVAGKPCVAIHLPREAGETLRLAAGEMARYAEMMSGARLPLQEARLPENALLLAPVGRSLASSPVPRFEADGYALCPVDDGLLLMGARPRSVLFGVYDLLERLGCRWFELGEEGEVVPRSPSLSLPGEERVEAPRFAMRGLVHGYYPLLADWLAKHRMNTSIVYGARLRDIEADGGLEALCVRDMTAEFGHHDFKRYFIDPATYYEPHPEWFGLRGSRRVGGYRGVCLCLTNREMEEQFARNVARLLEAHSWIDRVSVWPDDGMTPCECDACRRDAGEGRNISDHVLGFVNRIARRFPDKRFSHLVYQKTLRAFPAEERPLPNVDFCAIETNPDLLRAWRAVLDHDQPQGRRSGRLLFIYGYWGGFTGVVAQTRHYPAELGQCFDDFESAGVDGALTQACFGYPTGYCTNMLAMANDGWRNRRTHGEVMADYCEQGFGEWGGLMGEYLGAIEGLHGSIFREISPGYSIGKGFDGAAPRNRAVILYEIRKLLRAYDAFAPRFKEIPDNLDAAQAPKRLIRERVAFDYTHAALGAYERAYAALDTHCRARESEQGDADAFKVLARAVAKGLAEASRRLQTLEMMRERLVKTLGAVDKMTSHYYHSSAALLAMQTKEIADYRHDPLLVESGLAALRKIGAEDIRAAHALGACGVEPLATEAAGDADSPHQFVFRPAPGGFLEIELPIESAGEYSIVLNGFCESRMGCWRVLVGGREAATLDFYHMAFRSRGFFLGTFRLDTPRALIRFEPVSAPTGDERETVINPLGGQEGEADGDSAESSGWLALNAVELTWHAPCPAAE